MSMSMRVVPDSIIETLTCKICCKYLTVSPIGVHSDGSNVCGRCLYGKKASPACLFEFKDDLNYNCVESFIPLVLLGYATYSENLFPCVNRFEGCSKLLPFSTIRKHEETCVYKKIECPLCKFQGVGSQLVQHFRRDHKRYLSENNSVFTLPLNIDFSEIYLYRTGVSLFLVRVQYIKDICQFMFDTLCLGSPAPCKYGRLRILFKLPVSGFSTHTEYILLSDRLEMSMNCKFNMTFKINDFHLNESKQVICNYNIYYVE